MEILQENAGFCLSSATVARLDWSLHVHHHLLWALLSTDHSVFTKHLLWAPNVPGPMAARTHSALSGQSWGCPEPVSPRPAPPPEHPPPSHLNDLQPHRGEQVVAELLGLTSSQQEIPRRATQTLSQAKWQPPKRYAGTQEPVTVTLFGNKGLCGRN